MPEVGRIQSTNFQSLLTELGIPRNPIPFGLQSEVVPVVLVGGTVSFLASPTPAYQVTDIFSAGILTAPLNGIVLADTGPLPVGAYSLKILYMTEEVAGHIWDLQWRDAGNSANLFVHRFRTPIEASMELEVRLNIENDNERFRVVNIGDGTASIDYQATIFARI